MEQQTRITQKTKQRVAVGLTVAALLIFGYAGWRLLAIWGYLPGGRWLTNLSNLANAQRLGNLGNLSNSSYPVNGGLTNTTNQYWR